MNTASPVTLPTASGRDWIVPTTANCGADRPIDELPNDELPSDELPSNELPNDELPSPELAGIDG